MCDTNQKIIFEMPENKEYIEVAVAKHNFLPLNSDLQKIEFNKKNFKQALKTIEKKIKV